MPDGAYHRDRITWAAFAALLAFGFANAALGPALPYLREAQGSSYLVGALHQAAYALGGGAAGLLAARERRSAHRGAVIAGGLGGAALAGLAIGYGPSPAVTIAGALAMSFLGTSALIRVWAVLADVHGDRRAIAMSEGEVAVSLAGILTPLVIGAFAATALQWRFAFIAGALATWLAALWVTRTPMPPARAQRRGDGDDRDPAADRPGVEATLVIVFAIVALEFSLSFWLASYLTDDVGLGRGTAAAAVSGLYAAHLAGRVATSRLARRTDASRLLRAALVAALAGTPILLAATGAPVAAAGVAVTGIGIGALFPLTSALHLRASRHHADKALGEVLSVAALGQLAGPLLAGAIAQAAGLRTGLVVLPVFVLVALAAHGRRGIAPRRGSLDAAVTASVLHDT